MHFIYSENFDFALYFLCKLKKKKLNSQHEKALKISVRNIQVLNGTEAIINKSLIETRFLDFFLIEKGCSKLLKKNNKITNIFF